MISSRGGSGTDIGVISVLVAIFALDGLYLRLILAAKLTTVGFKSCPVTYIIVMVVRLR